MKHNRNAIVGKNVEVLFTNCLADHPKVLRHIKAHYNIDGEFVNCVRMGGQNEKCDVKIEFTCGKNIDVNIKAYKESMQFNQATRLSVESFCSRFKICAEDKEELWALILEKTVNKNSPLIPHSKQGKWAALLQDRQKEIIKFSLSKRPKQEILMLFNREKNIFDLYAMDQILKAAKGEVSYTPKGNIKLGTFMVLQRKGGNGHHVSPHMKKTDRKHPCNNIQIKLSIRSFYTCEIKKISTFRL